MTDYKSFGEDATTFTAAGMLNYAMTIERELTRYKSLSNKYGIDKKTYPEAVRILQGVKTAVDKLSIMVDTHLREIPQFANRDLSAGADSMSDCFCHFFNVK